VVACLDRHSVCRRAGGHPGPHQRGRGADL